MHEHFLNVALRTSAPQMAALAGHYLTVTVIAPSRPYVGLVAPSEAEPTAFATTAPETESTGATFVSLDAQVTKVASDGATHWIAAVALNWLPTDTVVSPGLKTTRSTRSVQSASLVLLQSLATSASPTETMQEVITRVTVPHLECVSQMQTRLTLIVKRVSGKGGASFADAPHNRNMRMLSLCRRLGARRGHALRCWRRGRQARKFDQ